MMSISQSLHAGAFLSHTVLVLSCPAKTDHINRTVGARFTVRRLRAPHPHQQSHSAVNLRYPVPILRGAIQTGLGGSSVIHRPLSPCGLPLPTNPRLSLRHKYIVFSSVG